VSEEQQRSEDPVNTPYRERILDYYRHPRNRGTIPDADISETLDNPVCGDVVRIDVNLQAGRVEKARFEGHGCVISMAAASMLTEVVEGKTLKELKTLTDGDVFEFLGITLGTVRAKCALLPLRTLQKGLHKLEAT